MKKTHLIWSVVFWIFLLIVSFGWNYHLILSNNNKVVLNKSQAFFEQILLSRAWNSGHGGVYVPVSKTTTPNPYLKDSLRDIVCENGIRLTKINPAYMTRQVSEINQSRFGLEFHITSLKPLNPGNKADEWETEALKIFENGTLEIFELISYDSISKYRYMAPLYTDKSCLNCHAVQGYKTGDVRGGISVSFPSDIYLEIIKHEILSLAFVHFIIALLGIIGLIVYRRMANKYLLIIEGKNKELAISNATKDKFFSIIAHDLKSPFNVILGYLNLLKSGFNNLKKDEQKEYIDQIDKSAHTTSKLLNDLLSWSRSQSNKIEVVFEELNLKSLIHDSIEPYIGNARMKDITCEVIVPDNLIIFSDKSIIKTIVANLFNNATKFTHANGIIKINASQKDNCTEVSVSDNGVGIQAEKISKLFQIDEHISTSGTNHEEGSGLGLLICKEFSEKLNGKIWIESEVGKGTKVIFTIPS